LVGWLVGGLVGWWVEFVDGCEGRKEGRNERMREKKEQRVWCNLFMKQDKKKVE
jgi:hypothetical protein